MLYEEFKEQIEDELRRNPEGLTWYELKARLNLPQKAPCYTWICWMEAEIGMKRKKIGKETRWSV